jgi:hypothetical protein
MTDTTTSVDELRPKYDETLLKNGIRGKYAGQYAASTNIVRLAPDVAAAFPNRDGDNETAQLLSELEK